MAIEFVRPCAGNEGTYQLVGTNEVKRKLISYSNDHASDTDLDVYLHVDCPKLGTAVTLTSGVQVWINKVVPKERPRSMDVSGGSWYDVTVYAQTNQPTAYVDDPTARPAIITRRGEEFDKLRTKDRFGNLIGTTAGEPFNNITVKATRMIYSVRKNVAVDPDWMYSLAGWVNSDFLTLGTRPWPPRTLQLRNVTIGEYTRENNIDFYPLQFELHGEFDSYNRYLLNRGRLERYGVNTSNIEVDNPAQWVETKLRPITDEEGELVSDPVFLKADGRKLLIPRAPETVTVMTTVNSRNVTILGLSEDLEETQDEGRALFIPGTGPFGRDVATSITTVTGPDTATVAHLMGLGRTVANSVIHDTLAKVWEVEYQAPFATTLPLT